MLNRFFLKNTFLALLSATTLIGVTASPAEAYHGYHGFHGYHGGYHHHYWGHHSFGHSFARGLGWGVGMGVGYGAVNYAFRNRDYGYYDYNDGPYYGGYGGRPVIDNSQTIIYNAPPPPPVSELPPAYPYPVPGYTTFNPGYGYTSGPITAPPNF